MNGREALLILTHLFRSKGSQTSIEEAVRFLSFRCRYGKPSDIRRLLSAALNSEMISRNGDHIAAEFMYNLQKLSPNQAARFSRNIEFEDFVEPLV
ncbi:MAG: hypothetical protein ACFFER_10155 [Candidatus Thorarchaeota archaeon]